MSLLKTPLHSWHSLRANMIAFAGFSMPVVYNSPSNITQEHLIVRNYAGLFDVSHMGRMEIKGPDAIQFLDSVIPRNISNIPVGKVAYCYLLNEKAGFRDDITIARTTDNTYLITWNAGNLGKIWYWINALADLVKSIHNLQFDIKDYSANTAMFAFQGPKAPEITESIFGAYPGAWKIVDGHVDGVDVLILGSGYTGEAGCELIIWNTSIKNPESVQKIWNMILDYDSQIKPCGLGARDTLRLEAGMSLYGNDITEQITPVEAKLAFSPLVAINKPFFIGQEALKESMDIQTKSVKRVGLLALKRGRSPRKNMKLYSSGFDNEIGFVTSGAFSPLLKIGMGMGYVPVDYQVGTIIEARINQKQIPLKIVNFPLYDVTKYGSKRISSS